MSSATLSTSNRSSSGLRPVRSRRDLAQIADLIEVCFAGSLDAGGYAALREMRFISRTGPLLWMLGRLTGGIPEAGGFVWEEGGRLVGNVTVMPTGYGRGFVIANVAVSPDYRRRGIARALMTAAMDRVTQQGRFAVLQVDADNQGACALYESLGFVAQRTFTRWRRAALKPVPPPDGAVLPLRALGQHDLPALMALAAQARPESRGGMGWLRPTHEAELRPSALGELSLVLGGKFAEVWGLSDTGGSLVAALRSEKRLSGPTTVIDLLIAPDLQGTLEFALTGEAVRRLGGRHQPLLTDHPTDDGPMGLALEQHAFRPERTLVHMLWTAPPGAR